MYTWNTKKHNCYDLSATEPITDKQPNNFYNSNSFFYKMIDLVYEHFLRHGILLLEQEQKQEYSKRIYRRWDREGINGSIVSKAVSPTQWLIKKTYSAIQLERSYVIVQHSKLKTTSAYWPIEKRTYEDENYL